MENYGLFGCFGCIYHKNKLVNGILPEIYQTLLNFIKHTVRDNCKHDLNLLSCFGACVSSAVQSRAEEEELRFLNQYEYLNIQI